MTDLSDFSRIVSNPVTINVVVGLLVIWAMVSLGFLHVKTRRLVATLRAARDMLEQSADAQGFATRYEVVNADMERHSVLGGRWRAYRESLLMPRLSGQPVRATVRPSVWFDMDILRAPGVALDPRYHAAMPNLLVGAGLLFTFLGLAVALGSAGGVVDGEATQRNDALKTLLDTASFKFYTSLAGMALSIVYAILRKIYIHDVEWALDAFQVTLERLMPLVTTVALQQEQMLIMERQATHIESFSNDLAVSLGSAIDQTFNERLAEHVGPLTDSIQRLSASMASRNEDAMKTMLDAFISRLDGGAGDHMKGVADSLSGLSMRLEGVQEGLGDAAMRMAQSADAMAARMGEGAEAALTRITDQMGSLAETLRSVANQTRDASDQAGGAMTERIGAAAESFERAAERISATLANAAASMEKRMGEQANESAERLTLQIEAMVGDLRSLAEQSRVAGTESLEGLAQRVTEAAGTFETTAAQVANALEKSATQTGGAFGKGAEDAVARIAEATEGMRNEMRAVLTELHAAMGEAGDSLRAGSETSVAAMRDSIEGASKTLAATLDGAANRIADAGSEAGLALQRGGENAGERLIGAASSFGERTSALAGEAIRLARAASMLSDRTAAFERAVGETTAPLVQSAADLKLAGAAAHSALEPLEKVTQAVAASVEQIAGAIHRLENVADVAGKLTNSLDDASKRFEGVDRELAKTLGGLQSGLQGFAKQVSTVVVETDSNLAKAVTQLQGMISSLEEALEDYAQHNDTRRRP